MLAQARRYDGAWVMPVLSAGKRQFTHALPAVRRDRCPAKAGPGRSLPLHRDGFDARPVRCPRWQGGIVWTVDVKFVPRMGIANDTGPVGSPPIRAVWPLSSDRSEVVPRMRDAVNYMVRIGVVCARPSRTAG
jgi:hypothetical protein